MRTHSLILSVLLASSALAQEDTSATASTDAQADVSAAPATDTQTDASAEPSGEDQASGEAQTTDASLAAPAPSDAAGTSPSSSSYGILVAPKLGFLEGAATLGGSPFAGLEVGFELPVLDRQLAVMVEGVWFQPRASGTIADPQLGRGGPGTATFGLRQREIGLSVAVAYFARGLVPVEGLTPYGTLGAGAYFHNSKASAFGETFRETGAGFGFNIQLGAQYVLGAGALFAELGYRGVGVNLILTGESNAGGFVLPAAGYRMAF